MKRSLHADEPSNDWFSEALTPASLKKKPGPTMDELPAVEVDPVEEAEPKKVETMAIHMTLLERYIQETEGT